MTQRSVTRRVPSAWEKGCSFSGTAASIHPWLPSLRSTAASALWEASDSLQRRLRSSPRPLRVVVVPSSVRRVWRGSVAWSVSP